MSIISTHAILLSRFQNIEISCVWQYSLKIFLLSFCLFQSFHLLKTSLFFQFASHPSSPSPSIMWPCGCVQHERQMTPILHCLPPLRSQSTHPGLSAEGCESDGGGHRRLHMEQPHTWGSVVVQFWKARDKFRTNIHAHRHTETRPGLRDAHAMTSIHKKMPNTGGHFHIFEASTRVESTVVLLLLCWSRISAKGDQNPAEEIAFVNACETLVFLCSAFKKASLFFLAPCLWSSQTISRGDAQEAPNSYQRADFPRDGKKMRAPALQEVGVYGPRAASTWICGNDCVCGWRLTGCRYMQMCACVCVCVLNWIWMCICTYTVCDSRRRTFSDKRKEGRQGNSQFITVPTFVMPLNTPSVRPSQIYWISISASFHLHKLPSPET